MDFPYYANLKEQFAQRLAIQFARCFFTLIITPFTRHSNIINDFLAFFIPNQLTFWLNSGILSMQTFARN